MNSEKHETKITHMVVVSNKIYSLLETKSIQNIFESCLLSLKLFFGKILLCIQVIDFHHILET